MLKFLKFVILFFTYLMVIDRSVVNCAKLKCSLYAGWVPGNLDSCNIDSANHKSIFQGARVTIDGIADANIGGKSYDEIKALNINGIISLNYFPANIENYFKNIEGIQIATSNLQEIRQSDLSPYTKLKYLYLYSNKITTIEKNLFEFNPNLELIDLHSNQISHIDPNVFDKLNKLNRLKLSDIKCSTTFTDVSTRSAVLDVIKRIQKGECAQPEMLEKKMETQSKQFTQNITSLQTANDELSTKVSELNNKYSSVNSDKEICLKNLNECQSKVTTNEQSNNELINKNRLLLQDANDLKSKLLEKEEKVINLMEKNGELQKNLDESKKLSDEREKKLIIAEQSNALKDRLLQNEQTSTNSNGKIDKILGKLDEVSTQIESIKNVKGKNAAQNQATDDDSNADGECLKLYFGPQTRPIILSN